MLTHEKSANSKVPGVGQQKDMMQKTDNEISKDKPLAQAPLFVAGKIIHVTLEPIARARYLVKTWLGQQHVHIVLSSSRLGCRQKKERTLAANWVPPTNFSELCMGEDMFSHHLPDVMLKVFQELLAQEKLLAVKT